MTRSTQRTLYMLDLDMHRSFGKQYKPMLNTTLNEKFGVLTNLEPKDKKAYPTLNCYCIGCGGSVIIDENPNYTFNEHSPVDGALFKHVPFIVRELANDLDDNQRQDYRMRVIETIGNKEYACYYLKTLTGAEIKQLFYSIRTVTDGVSVSAPTLSPLDTNISTILNPVPGNRNVTYKNMDSVEYVTLLNKQPITLTVEDLKEIQNAMTIKGITNDHITEIGICSSIEYDYGTYKENIYTQIAYHIGITLNIILQLNSGDPVTKQLELGGMEPYIK